jgi:MFS family permease
MEYGAYRRFALSLLLTSLGVQLLQAAILWQVYLLTGSALALGLTGLARAGPHIALSLIGGVAADRVNRVRLIQTGQVANGILVVLLSVLTLTGQVALWHLYVVTFLNGSFTALTQPARSAIIPWLIPREKLVNAVALNSTITQTSQITGPAFAGLAIGLAGLGPVYVCNGAFYLLAMVAIMAVKVPDMPRESVDSPWRSFREGLRFVRSKPVIISLLSLDVSQTVFGSYKALLPLIATSLGAGATGYGLLSAAPGVGSIVGSGFIMSLGDMRYKGMFTVFGVLGYCASLALLAGVPLFVLAFIPAGLLGACNSIQAIPRNSAIISIAPDELRGRVEAFRSMLAGGGPPLGDALSGALASALGPAMALVVGGMTCATVVSGIGFSRKELRDPYLGSAVDPRVVTVEAPPDAASV